MEISLSSRLSACCSFVSAGDRVADIGCDHGYLGIWLLKNGIAKTVIAADVKPQPLESAMRNAEKYDVSDKMSFFLSDGVRNIPREFDTLVCAGMGGDTMISILEAAPWLQSSTFRLILQCQSRTPMLRAYLSDHGYRINQEKVLRDGRFLYTVMEVLWAPGQRLSPAECYFPPALLECPTTDLPAYYRQVITKLERAVNGRGELAEPTMAATLKELKALAEQPGLTWLKEDQNDNCS